jgi:hypothetical protein
MDEKKLVVGYLDDHYVLLDTSGVVVAVLAPGMMFEIWTGGEWQAIGMGLLGSRPQYACDEPGLSRKVRQQLNKQRKVLWHASKDRRGNESLFRP